uniref:NADH:ubiquinone oxidoreductase intermediate-associated protein 30 domain-containing protein n=1 Tax=Bionectria ochroleuca TaxID=29856 RepID=A0A0B7KD17_BIOOC
MAASNGSAYLDLFGGTQKWDASEWVTSDDRVRGGSSVSRLAVSDDGRAATFTGHLDTSTLGGAGFASQRTRDTLHQDLSAYDGLLVTVTGGDSKRYAITLKDEIPGRRDDGRDLSGVSWEADFALSSGGGEGTNESSHADQQTETTTRASATDGQQVYLPWGQFKATYRGRPKPDAEPLDLTDVKRFGIMMRRSSGAEHLNNRSAFDETEDEEDQAALEKRARGTLTEIKTPNQEGDSSKTSGTSPPVGWRRAFCGFI